MTSSTISKSVVGDFDANFQQNPEREALLGDSRRFIALTPLTSPHTDSLGHRLQLYKAEEYGLVGLIFHGQEISQIVPSSRIHNPLNPRESSARLVERLESSSCKVWDLAFDVHSLTITVWPHLVAAAKGKTKGGTSREIFVRGSPIRYLSEQALLQKIQTRGYERSSTDPDEWILKVKDEDGNFTGEKRHIHFDREGEGNTPHERTHIDYFITGIEREPERQLRELTDQRDEIDKQCERGEISQREAKLQRHPINQKIKDLEKYLELKAKWRFAYGDKPPPDKDPRGGGGKPPPSKGGDDPATKNFTQRLQQTRLTDSYNGTHRQNPVPAKGGTGGDIGGVACGMEYFRGLFNTPEALFEHNHYFCMPVTTRGGVPFTQEQLRQILRELAIGVYTHNTIPFFSLHFRQGSADLFPVIHPAYQNTLVGRVIGMLDYFMKGYLNGGVFTEEFIDRWHKSARQNPASALEHLIDFEKYCQEHLEGSDKEYKSAKALHEEPKFLYSAAKHLKNLDGFGEQDQPDRESVRSAVENVLSSIEAALEQGLGAGEGSSDLTNFIGFGNSFRIIAKQKSVQKQDGLFVIDSDFDVFYTIAPPSEYERESEKYVREHGREPPPYKNLVAVYEEMRKRIHDHMVKMPLCRDYFAMLGVIGFFSGYFSTLKKHRKVPVLFPVQQLDQRGCPPLFPHLPIKVYGEEAFRMNLHQAMKTCFTVNRTKLRNHFSRYFRYL